MIHFFWSFLGLFPDNIEPFIRVLASVFIAFGALNLILVLVDVVKRIVHIFIPGG